MAQVIKCHAVTIKKTQCQRNAVVGNYCTQHSKNNVNISNTMNDTRKNIKDLTHPHDVYIYTVNNSYTSEVNKQLIKIVLSQVHPETKIDHEALEYLDKITYKLYQEIHDLKTEDDLLIKIKEFPVELSRHCTQEYQKAKLRYSEEYGDKILLVLKVLVVEYLMAEILELAGNEARDFQKKTINYYHLCRAIAFDFELFEMFEGIDMRYFRNYRFPANKEYVTDIKNFRVPKTLIKNHFPEITSEAIEFIQLYTISDLKEYKESDFHELGIHGGSLSYFLKFKEYYNLPAKITFKNLTDLVLSEPMIPGLKKLWTQQIKVILDPKLIPDLLKMVVKYI